ncbi:MAG TPA: hypothetical protein VFW07_23035 [Parafilimonas sp.]|nr:hypothetical protein [Parafilimonas sp.]
MMKFNALISPVLLLPFLLNPNSFGKAATQLTKDYKSNTNDITVKFGVMVAKTEGKLIPPAQQVQVAKALGVQYIRGRIDIQGWSGSNAAYDTYTDAGLKVLLNINYGIPRSAAGDFAPVPFPTDMDGYSKSLNSILDKYKPEVVVIENEEDNPNYHAGSADDYVNQLKTAIQVAHSKGLKITNGGITVREVCLIIYDDYVQRGQKDKAMDFAKHVFPPVLLQRLNNPDNPTVARQLEFGRKIIAAYKTLDLDYINFHWYEPVRARGQAAEANGAFDPQAFAFVVNYLKTTTGKPVLTNEFGTFNTSPELTKNLLQAVKDGGLSYAIFYSADGGTGKAVALQNANGELRGNGIAFRDFVAQH